MPTEKVMRKSPFEIDSPFRDPIRQTMFGLLKRPLERFFRLRTLSSLYQQVTIDGEDPQFAQKALDLLNVCYEVSDKDLAKIPREGPVIVVCNHPFGAIEGLLLAALMKSVRDDVKIMANFLLSRIQEMRPLLISVDPYRRKEAKVRNIRPMKEALEWVKNGSMLGLFPAGGVSHLHWRKRVVADPKWNKNIARLIRRTGASVLPIYFYGRNSNLFQVAGLFHPLLRTVLLPNELLNKTNKKIPVRIGNPIPFDRLQKYEKDSDLIEYIRLRTYLLTTRIQPKADDLKVGGSTGEPGIKEIASPIDTELLTEEIKRLTSDSLLAENADYAVYRARVGQIPGLMREIGRMREITFREIGEGTGRTIDVDRFDTYYQQLFVWNKRKKEIVGGYRLGFTDEILRERGIEGLYTRTLFKYKKKLISQINPAIELGRSFIRPEYQREYAPLHLLWRAIGQVVCDQPKYKMLFGPVSITNRYRTASMQLMVSFLKANRFSRNLARLVKPKSPLKVKKSRKWDEKATSRLVTDVDEVTSLISEIEAQHKGIPVLLRQYLKLGGKLLGFNVDPEFSDTLDGLILVDLLDTPTRILEKYLGRDGVEKFHAYHGCRAGSGNS